MPDLGYPISREITVRLEDGSLYCGIPAVPPPTYGCCLARTPRVRDLQVVDLHFVVGVGRTPEAIADAIAAEIGRDVDCRSKSARIV